jgi:PilZ domain
VSIEVAENARYFERRFNPRSPYSGHIFFATKDRFYEGKLANFSRYGLFIKTTEPPDLEAVLTIALPFSDGRQSKCKGQIVWRNAEGIGVELFKKRSPVNLRIIK